MTRVNLNPSTTDNSCLPEAILHDIYQNHNDICCLQGDR